MSTLQEAMQRAGLVQAFRPKTRRLNELDSQLSKLLREIEDKLRARPDTCRRVVAVPFEHPEYEDPHELAWSCRNGKWRLVLRWADGADPVSGCSRTVRAAVIGSDALRELAVALGVRL